MAANLHLPSPARTVRMGVRVCKRMGLDEPTALETIMDVCASVYQRNSRDGGAGLVWLAEVSQAARVRLRERGGYS